MAAQAAAHTLVDRCQPESFRDTCLGGPDTIDIAVNDLH